MQVKKTTAEKYLIRGGKNAGFDWAVFFLDDEVGDIATLSCYGTYSYVWGRPGRGDCTLKEFLVSADHYYILDKFSYGIDKWYDHETTIKRIKSRIINCRRENLLEKETARHCWEEAEDIDGGIRSTDELYGAITSTNVLFACVFNHDMGDVPVALDYKPSLRHFMERVWPRFIEVLKNEF